MAKKKQTKRKKHPVMVFLLVVLTILSLLGISFRLVLLPFVTSIIAENTVNSHLSALDHDGLVEVAEMGRAYVAGDLGSKLPEGEDERVAFTPDVVNHMEDVRSVIQAALIVTIILVVLLLIAIIYAGKKTSKRTISTGLLLGGILAVTFALALVVIGLISFEALFTTMHELLFADGTWTFAEDSLLICTYPEPFWVAMGAVWGVFLVLLSAIVSVVGLLLKR